MISDRPLCVFRNVRMREVETLRDPRLDVSRGAGARFEALLRHAQLDGLGPTFRKLNTRFQGVGQYSKYVYCEFEAKEMLVGSDRSIMGNFSGIAIGQPFEHRGRVDLLSWRYDLRSTEPIRHGPRLIKFEMPRNRGSDVLSVGVIGAGAYVRNVVIPSLLRAGARVAAIADASPARAHSLGSSIPQTTVFSEPRDLIDQAGSFDGIVVACSHSSHAGYATAIVERECPVLVEKPVALNRNDLADLLSTSEAGGVPIRVGHNRRYARDFLPILASLDGASSAHISISVETYWIPEYHWYFAPSEGGRVLGNLTHWLDLALALGGDSEPRLEIVRKVDFGLIVILRFESLQRSVLVEFFEVGHRLVAGAELVAIRTPKETIQVQDWSMLTIDDGEKRRVRRRHRDRGHEREYAVWCKSVSSGTEWDSDVQDRLRNELRSSHSLALDVLEALK